MNNLSYERFIMNIEFDAHRFKCNSSMSKLFVSVIIPNYNHACYLDERIQSVLNQTYQNFEVIILDDKSTDNSVEVINKYKDNPHISHIVLNNENSGSTFKQWQKGFDLAEGELIWIAESDDSCENNFLFSLIEMMNKDNSSIMAFCRSMVIDENGINKYIYPSQREINHSKKHENGRFAGELKYKNIVVNASSCIFRKDSLKNMDKTYMGFQGCGDWLFWILIAEQGTVWQVSHVLNKFRMHSTNTTQKLNYDGTNDREVLQIANYLYTKKHINKKQLEKWKVQRLKLHRRNPDMFNKAIEKSFRKEWGIGWSTVIISWISSFLQRLCLFLNRFIV